MRDPERQDRFGSSFDVSMPDFPGLVIQPRYIQIYQSMGYHDVVELYYQNFSPFLLKAIKTGVPVKINWKNDKVKGTFFGYTSEVTHVSEQILKRGIKITCVAASYVLKEKESKIWVNKTASEIVTDIAKKFGLKPVVTPTTDKFTQQSLAGHSYWEKLRELADRVGYGVQATETELHFHPIDTMIDKFLTVAPVMAFLDPLLNASSTYNAQTLDSFTPKIGDFVQSEGHNRTDKTVSGVDPLTSKVLTFTSSPKKTGKSLRKDVKDPLFSQPETSIVVGSQKMAESMSIAKSNLSRFSIPANGVGQGDPRIAPWRTIEIRGINDSSNGYWIVKTANHFIHIDGRYQVEFTCATDGVGANKPSVTRPSQAGTSPSRNIAVELSTPISKPTVTKLSAPATMFTQAKAGFKVTPRRWKGR